MFFRVDHLGANQGEIEARTKLLHAALRQVMSDHSIPSDWMDLRAIGARNSDGQHGIHVQLVACGGGQTLLSYVTPLQESFKRVLRRLDPASPSWVFGLTWVFDDPDASAKAPLAWQVDAGQRAANRPARA